MARVISQIDSRDMVALNADVVGYSGLMADDFAATTSAMAVAHGLVSEQVAAAGGILVNFVGDNFMAVFDDAAAAMRAAISISSELEREDPGEGGTAIRFRMGIDKGPVTVSGDDYFGEALNVAARIQALARPGGVSVSRAVFGELDEPALRFRSTGSHRLKNIPGDVEVFEFADLPSVRTPDAPPLARSLGTPSIAVLPVHGSGLGPEADGIPELLRADIVHRLAEVPNLRVIDAPAEGGPGTRLTPAYLLETGMIRYGNTGRFYAKLMEVASMNIVTSHKWTGTPEQLVAQSDEIADTVARSVEVELIIGEPAREYSQLEDPEAIRTIYRGWYHLTTDTPEGNQRAIELFDQIIAKHPDSMIGYSLAAFAHWVGAAEGITSNPSEHYRRAAELARQGTALGDATGLAEMVQAATLLSTGNPGEAIDLMERVEIKRPTCDITYGLAASMCRYVGEWERSIDLLDVAMRLTAMNKPWYPTVQAAALYIGGRLDAAASTAAAVLEHQPRNLEALLVLAAAQVELGQLRRGRATAATIRRLFPAVDVAAWFEHRPYQIPDVIDRWKRALAELGLVETVTEPA